MSGLSLGWTIALGIPALVTLTGSVALARALRTYSRSRLEDVCELRGCPKRVDEIERDCERTERSAEALALLCGSILAVLVGAHLVVQPDDLETEATGLVLLLGAVLGQVVAGAIGRVWAETLLATIWPVAALVRLLAWPLTAVTIAAEWIVQRFAGHDESPRPTSVEVEIPPDADHPEVDEVDLPESTREILERVVELSRLDVSEIMKQRASVLELSAEVTALDAARAFGESGFSRIPLYGESRDDIVGVLYAKDLFPAIVRASDPGQVVPRKLARTPHFIPETKNANDLLQEFRNERLQIALVLNEYGAVVGLVTFEDLIEQLVGPITDEHDPPEDRNEIVSLGDSKYDVSATVSIDDLNERFDLHLPNDGDIQTVGGYVFHELGRMPEPGASVRVNGVAITVTQVKDHSIRRVRLEVLQPAPKPAD